MKDKVAKKKIDIHFLGAAETVTGSKFLIDTGEQKILVDCGLFQGLKELRVKNWDYFPVDVSQIDTILLTHGHMDHCGYLPRMIKMGFKNTIQAVQPTLDIAKIILLDSAKIQEEQAERANKGGYSKHSPAEPLYTVDEAKETLEHFTALPIDEWIDLYPNIRVRFQYNGHIIGATFIELDIHGKRFVFSGDIGRKEDLLMYPFKKPKKADVLFIESTYGDRLHHKEDVFDRLKKIIKHTYVKGGTLIIPSFAVERTQVLMYILWQLRKNEEIPSMPMIMDSPMGANVLEVFDDYDNWHKLSQSEYDEMCRQFRIIREYKETIQAIENTQPKIVIAGSGMLSGGRVLSYLQKYINREETSILLAGFQAAGTRGRKLLDGMASLKIYGEYYPVKAEIFNLEVLSAHADQNELIDWLSCLENQPEEVFIVHGEEKSAKAFKAKLKEVYQWESSIPTLYSIKTIE